MGFRATRLGGCGFEPRYSLPVVFTVILLGGSITELFLKRSNAEDKFLVRWDVTLSETLTFNLNGGVCVRCDSFLVSPGERGCLLAFVCVLLLRSNSNHANTDFRHFFQSGLYSLDADGLKTFSGNNTSRYSYLVKGHENPYYLAADV